MCSRFQDSLVQSSQQAVLGTQKEVHSSTTRRRYDTRKELGSRLACERNHSCTSSLVGPGLVGDLHARERVRRWLLAGGRRLWTQLMPGAYTDDGSAKGAAALGRVPWFAWMPRDISSMSDYMGWMRWVLLDCERVQRVSTNISSEITRSI